jgi:G6PDH family F420-dependent oxidoreductase
VFLGVGSGEALNEVPAGGGWGPFRERNARLAEAVGLIRQLWGGQWVTHPGPYFPLANAKLYDLPPEPVPIYVAAGGPRSARLAGEIGDGWITVGGSALDEQVAAAFREGARAAGKDPVRMPVLVEHYLVVGGQAEAEEAARYWRFIGADFKKLEEPDPREILRRSEELATLEQVYRRRMVSADPRDHAGAIRRYWEAGVTDVFVHSRQMDQQRVIEFFGQRVLPLLGKERAG